MQSPPTPAEVSTEALLRPPGVSPVARAATWWAALRADPVFPAAAALGALWALWLNFVRIAQLPVATDEPEYARAGWYALHPHDHALMRFANREHPPLAKLLFGFAQLFVGHPSWVADRVVAALCTLATGVLLAVWVGRVAGRWVGLGVGLSVAVLPLHAIGVTFRFGRYGMLDPVAEVFMFASVVIAWEWSRRDGRAAWWWAVGTGVAVGFAAAAKENGFLGAVGPVLVVVALAAGNLQRFARRVAQTLTAVVAACGAFLLTYLPIRHPFGAIHAMIQFQTRHARDGHFVVVAGHLTTHPPGWAFFWFAWQGMGTPVAVVTLLGVAAALALRHDRFVVWCLAALAAPIAFHTTAGVILPFYWVMWVPAYLALAGVGIAELARIRYRVPGAVRTAGTALAAVGVVVLLTSSVHDTVRTTTQGEVGPSALGKVMRRAGLHGRALYSGFSSASWYEISVPGGPPTANVAELPKVDTVVVATPPLCLHAVSRVVRAVVALHQADGSLHEIYHDRQMTVYAASSPLTMPTQEELRQFPAINGKIYC